jgi:DNA-binding response OmpR family regulator
MKSNYSHTNGIVMIVDDTPGNLALLSDTLSEAGYRVLVATDGQSALEQIVFLKPDIILLDVMMPGIDGFETCNRLKSDPDTAHIPVLFMTALSELDNLLRGFGEGAVDYLVKPIRPPEVLARVDVQLTQARNLHRVTNALNNSPFSAVAINSSGNITWLSPGGTRWLDEFLQHHLLTGKNERSSPLPKPILEWVKQRLAVADNVDEGLFESYRAGVNFFSKNNTLPKYR